MNRHICFTLHLKILEELYQDVSGGSRLFPPALNLMHNMIGRGRNVSNATFITSSLFNCPTAMKILNIDTFTSLVQYLPSFAGHKKNGPYANSSNVLSGTSTIFAMPLRGMPRAKISLLCRGQVRFCSSTTKTYAFLPSAFSTLPFTIPAKPCVSPLSLHFYLPIFGLQAIPKTLFLSAQRQIFPSALPALA